MASKQEILGAYMGRITANDLEGAAGYSTDDVVFHWAGHGPLAGEYTGKAAVVKMFADYASMVDASIEPHDSLFSNDHVVALVRATLSRGDRSVATNRVVVYHFAGDKISEVWVVDADQQAVAELLA